MESPLSVAYGDSVDDIRSLYILPSALEPRIQEKAQEYLHAHMVRLGYF